MKHLFVSREYPPAPYPPGGIGTYVTNIARLLAERGEEVHVVGQRWNGAPLEREVFLGGNLIVHRVGTDDLPRRNGMVERFVREREGLKKTAFPKQWFGWLAADRIEQLVDEDGIDVIEGQEWEAPLYHFLLRRTLGLGPSRSPPCIVHLHSPTEWINRFNGPTSLPREYLTMKRMETFCIRTADALLCPSNTFARQAEAHYALPVGRVHVIHLPKGPTVRLARDAGVWANGSICFVGRLEPRKGVIEWIEAAMNVAREDSGVLFDFIGADLWGLQATLTARLPPDMRPRFRFHGSKPASELVGFLAQARAAVVPSRWENFPNVCMEAMGSGLPVIATRCGGMAEMIEDEQTGWLSPELSAAGMVDGLSDTLRRCLATSPAQRAQMGEAASDAITRICDNDRIVEEHIAFRADVLRQGAQRSLTAAALSHDLGDNSPVRATQFGGNCGIVVCAKTCADAEPLLRYIRAQQTAAAAIAVVCPKTISHAEAVRLGEIAGQSVVTLRCRASLRSEAWNTGYSSLRERVGSGFFLFLDGDDLLQPDCLALMKQTFAHRPEAGLVAGWTGREDSFPMDVPLCPELSHQLMRTELGSACAFRAEAIGNAVPFRALPKHYDLWQLSVAVLANGWIGVTVAAMLAERRGQQDKLPWPETTALRAIRAEILQTAAGRISPIALDLLNDYAPLSSPADAGAKSGVAQIMKLLKAGARRKISNVRTRLLPSRRPKEPA